jgi:hypothetical protein
VKSKNKSNININHDDCIILSYKWIFLRFIFAISIFFIRRKSKQQIALKINNLRDLKCKKVYDSKATHVHMKEGKFEIEMMIAKKHKCATSTNASNYSI